MDFICNICGTSNVGVEKFGREVASCTGCHSSVRVRALLAALSLELFGTVLKLSDFPVIKTIHGIGLSDAEDYARILEDRFSYRNTFYDHAPQFDVSVPHPEQFGTLDFLLSTEVFEHVRPPVEETFRHVSALLRPGGVLVMTVPYKPAGTTDEHYPELHDYATVALREGTVLVNRTPSGELQVFDNLVFHGGPGSTLELRVFSESGLRQALAGAGFEVVRFYGQDYPQFGIVHSETWSLPLAARRKPADESREWFRELVEWHRTEVERERQRTDQMHTELVARTAWAQDLDRQLNQQGENYRKLAEELEARTKWALSLESELQEKTRWAIGLDADVRARTEWAQSLERQLTELGQKVKALEAERQARTGAWHRLGQLLRGRRD